MSAVLLIIYENSNLKKHMRTRRKMYVQNTDFYQFYVTDVQFVIEYLTG